MRYRIQPSGKEVRNARASYRTTGSELYRYRFLVRVQALSFSYRLARFTRCGSYDLAPPNKLYVYTNAV